MKDRFYLSCYRDNFGGKVVFHAANRSGYTTNIDKAETLNRADAQKAWESGREFDKPISADHVDAVANLYVDMQVIPNETTRAGDVEYVGIYKGAYSGNDVKFVTQIGGFIYSKPVLYAEHEINDPDFDSLFFIPKALADKHARRAVQVRNINDRTFIQGAGIKQPAHVRRSKRRTDSGKTRWNCPSCGKISWQYNPYDFDGCIDVCCDKWRSPYT